MPQNEASAVEAVANPAREAVNELHDPARQAVWPHMNVAYDAAVKANPALMEALSNNDLREAFMVGLMAITALRAEEGETIERCAKVAEAHRPDRILKNKPLSYYDHEDREIIRAEENGEAVAASCIAAAIRALAPPAAGEGEAE